MIARAFLGQNQTRHGAGKGTLAYWSRSRRQCPVKGFAPNFEKGGKLPPPLALVNSLLFSVVYKISAQVVLLCAKRGTVR
jgi:hypothetical protein